MKKMILLGLLALFVAFMASGQEKVEAPVWNVGGKWVFTQGFIEVVENDQNGYFLEISENTCIQEIQGCKTIIFEKAVCKRIYMLAGDKHEKYSKGLKDILNFPLGTGKEWKSAYSSTPLFGFGVNRWADDYSESTKVQGWEDVEVRAGKFKAFGLEYKRVITDTCNMMPTGVGMEIKNHYWYSPAVKIFVKCQYDKAWKDAKEIFNWELTSFQLKK